MILEAFFFKKNLLNHIFVYCPTTNIKVIIQLLSSPKQVRGLHIATEPGRLSLFEGKEREETNKWLAESESWQRVAHT